MIIIVLGLPGSGKSYFASRFAKRIHADYVNSDRVRKSMFPARSYSEKEKASVYDEMLELTRRSVKQRKDLVLDATFYKDELRRKFADAAGGELIFIEVEAEEAIVKERLKQKRADSEADFEIYKVIKQQWEPLRGHRLILLSTNDNIEDMLNQAIDYLKLRDDKRAYC
ncbi:MAG: AAA family ATPase [Bacteroidota bacterium]|nr:AAA family ATPase [Bacteroidota bacterium]MDP4216582.1 AAA family ATPase [Bacteroidota bacterium]MDP4246326.1 AAA family ATPase [Bacteroidota bacterium]MDP4254754.1 AAA family ATPase [Bacteroidota bacterium]MDP4259873.1 AAA family ATPase [Bacteroidota bacterium]